MANSVGAEGPRSPEWESAPFVVGTVTLIFLSALIIYLVRFYGVEYAEGVPRYQPLGYLLVPDELALQWAGDAEGAVWMWDRVPLFATGLGIGLAAWGLGSLILRVLRVESEFDRLERFVFGMGLGLSGLSLGTLALGLSGRLHQPLWFLGMGFALVVVQIGRVWRDRRQDSRRGHKREVTADIDPWWRPRWWWLLVPFLIVFALGSVLPPIDFDVLEYHLQVPKEWFQQGTVTFLPHNVYGNMPLGAETLALLAMVVMPGELGWWWGALAGKLIMASFAPLTALMLFAAGRRFFAVEAGVVAALLYMSTAGIASVSLNGLNDAVVAFYLLAAAYATHLWMKKVREGHLFDSPADDRGGHRARIVQWPAPAARMIQAVARFWCVTLRPWGILIVAGLMAGSAAACKYTAVVYVVCPIVVLLLCACRGRRLAATVVFSTAVLVACGLWYAKNGVLAGNPTYPLLHGVFAADSRTPELDLRWRRAHQVPRDQEGARYSPSQLYDSALLVLGRSRWHHPLMIPLAALLVLRRRMFGSVAFWAGGSAVVLAVWWLLTHRIDRFWVPALPLMALLAGVGASWSSSIIWRCSLWSVLALGLLANFVVISSSIVGDNRYFVGLERLRDDPELSHVSLVHRFLNEHWSSGRSSRKGRVLVVGDAAVFDLQVPILYNTCFDESVFERVFRGRKRAARLDQLRQLNVSHIYISWAEIRRYLDAGNYGFTDYVTPTLVHDELIGAEHLLRRVAVPGLEDENGELFEVVFESD